MTTPSYWIKLLADKRRRVTIDKQGDLWIVSVTDFHGDIKGEGDSTLFDVACELAYYRFLSARSAYNNE